MSLSLYLQKYGIEYKENLCTARLSSIKAGGYAKYVIYPKSTDELITSVKLSDVFLGKFKIIGGCTNTFFDDGIFTGAAICTKKINQTKFDGYTAALDCGASLSASIKACAALGINLGAELFGIPGTVGGGIRNNAGAYDTSLSDVFLHGVFYDAKSDKILNLNSEDLNFSYRYSLLSSLEF